MNPARNVIDKCGGPQIVAEILGVSITQVYRYGYPRDKGGTGGLIPAEHMQTLLRAARERGISLSPNDFVQVDAEALSDGGSNANSQGKPGTVT